MKWRVGTAAMWLVVAVMTVALAGSVATPAAAQNRAARPQVTRPEGPVWEVLRKNCTRCHGIDDYAYYSMDRAGWQAFIESKHRTGGGAGATASLSEIDRNLILDWVVATFGPETKPFPRAYVPAEITEFFSDPEANRLIARACVGCHAVDRVNNARNSPTRWRILALQMRERGAVISDDELERLVEWLGRVKGTNDVQ
jgi:cytochrome c553